MSLNVNQLTKPLKIARRIQETPEAVSLTLTIPEEWREQFRYQAGQFVTFFLNLNGETLNRSYSLSSAPGIDSEFQVTVKKVQGGRGSTYLCEQAKVGDVLATTPPSGHFFKPSTEPTHYFLLAAGSGVTPVFSILKTVLKSSALHHVTLIFCNRNQQSIIYRIELERWAREYPNRLDVVHVLSKPEFGWPGPSGRLDRTLLGELLDIPRVGPRQREFYLCGPSEFMHLVRSTLLDRGVTKDAIREENFGLAVHAAKPEVKSSWTLIGDSSTPNDTPEKIIAVLNGRNIEVAAKVGQSVLETLLEAGAEPPYSCMDGACMACLGKVVEGRVYQEDPGILSDDNIANRETLTCQAKPLAKIVKISYDNL